MHVHGLAVDATVATQRCRPSEAPKTMPRSLLCWTPGSRRGPQGHQCLPVPVWAKMSPSWTPLHLALSICPSPAARICAAALGLRIPLWPPPWPARGSSAVGTVRCVLKPTEPAPLSHVSKLPRQERWPRSPQAWPEVTLTMTTWQICPRQSSA